MSWPASTHIKPGQCLNPKGRGPSKNKNPFDQLQSAIVDLVKMPLAVLPNQGSKLEFQRKLNEAALRNPAGYIVKVVIPMLRLLPQTTVIQVFADITNATDEGEVAHELRAIRQVLSEAVKKGMDLDKLLPDTRSTVQRTSRN